MNNKMTRVLGVAVAALGFTVGLAGCQEDNDKAAIEVGAPGVTPTDAPTSSEAAYNQQAGSSPMEQAGKSGGYPAPR